MGVFWTSGVYAQDDSVKLTINHDHLGLGGLTRLGSWTPVLLTLENRSSDPRKVVCQWIYHDSDGDEVTSQRALTLSPQQTQQAWIYGTPPVTRSNSDKWRFRVLDEKDKRPLAFLEVPPGQLAEPSQAIIAVTGPAMLGLEPYTHLETQHETCRVLRDLDPALIPDRWYGLSLIETLIWTPFGRGPTDAAISPDTHRAIRQWVLRGGHLIIVLPQAGDTWFDSPLAGILPKVRVDVDHDAPPPAWLGRPTNPDPATIDLKRLHPADERVSVLLRDRDHEPVVVARRVGFGRVTLIGVDLTAPLVMLTGLPNGPSLWKSILGWQSPAYTKSEIEAKLKAQQIINPSLRYNQRLDRFMVDKIAMYGTASPAVLTALILFTLYWLAAGPIGFGVLKKRGLARHSWVAFLGVVVVFSVIAWSAAAALRPTNTAAEHFTVLDIDSGSGLVRARSWLSLFSPQRGHLPVAVGSEDDAPGRHTLASADSEPGGDGGFIDQQQYKIKALSPHEAALPFRATAKQIQVDYLDRGQTAAASAPSPWLSFQGQLRFERNRLVGSIRHDLPGDLSNLLIAYCPGDGKTPLIWRQGVWRSGHPRNIDLNASDSRPLVSPYKYDKDKRLWMQEGYLGELFANNAGGAALPGHHQPPVPIADDQIVVDIELLTFYSYLPPPDYRTLGYLSGQRNRAYKRHWGRKLDLGAIVPTRCVILIGYLEDAPTPVPMTLQAQPFDSAGWAVVRWVLPVDETP